MTNRAYLGKLISTLRHFNDIDSKMQVSTILTFLETAAATEDDRDLSLRELEKRIGYTSGVASRNAYYWGEGAPGITGAHKFVNVHLNPVDRRLRNVRLTPRGETFLHRILGDNDGTSTGQQVPS